MGRADSSSIPARRSRGRSRERGDCLMARESEERRLRCRRSSRRPSCLARSTTAASVRVRMPHFERAPTIDCRFTSNPAGIGTGKGFRKGGEAIVSGRAATRNPSCVRQETKSDFPAFFRQLDFLQRPERPTVRKDRFESRQESEQRAKWKIRERRTFDFRRSR